MPQNRKDVAPHPLPVNPGGHYEYSGGDANTYNRRWPPTKGAIGAASPSRQNFADKEAKHPIFDNFNLEGESFSLAYVANTLLDIGAWYAPTFPMVEGKTYDVTYKMINFHRTAASVTDPELETPHGFDSGGYYHPLTLHLRKVTPGFDAEPSPKTAPFVPADVAEFESMVQIPWAPDASSFGRVRVVERVTMTETIAKPVFSVSFENFHTPGSTIPNSAPTSALNIMIVVDEALPHNKGATALVEDFWAGDPVDPFSFFGEFGGFNFLEPLIKIEEVFEPTCTTNCTTYPDVFRGTVTSKPVPVV